MLTLRETQTKGYGDSEENWELRQEDRITDKVGGGDIERERGNKKVLVRNSDLKRERNSE